MSRIAVCILFLLCMACDQASKANTIVPKAGPRGVAMNTALAVVVNAPVDFKCSFQGGGKRAFVIYHLVSNVWAPMLSCNNGALGDVFGRLSTDDADPRRLITGWYEMGQGWQQCDITKWKNDGHTDYLSCTTPDGWASTFSCVKGRCARP